MSGLHSRQAARAGGADLHGDAGLIERALPMFLSEAREQTDRIEQLLLELEDAPGDRALLDELFRCAHTVKGSAGVFGLDRVVAFTHHVETLLDRMREGAVALTPRLGTVLLRCNDTIRRLVGAAADPQDESADEADERAALEQALQAATGATDDGAAGLGGAPPDMGPPPDVGPPPGLRHWHVSVEFGPDTYRNGLDPLAVLHYVRGLGTIDAIECDAHALPALEALDPESCFLAFHFSLDTDAHREEIEAAFSFVRDDCTLHLVEPGATVEQVVALIEAMPERPRLGEILLAAGAITRAQLEHALRTQAAKAAAAQAPALLGQTLQAQAGVSPAVVEAALRKQERPPRPGDDGRFIRVQADRLDAVINLLGELVIAGAGAALLARQSGQGALVEANLQIGRLIEEIRNGTLQLRMVPIGETFARFRRVVRDTAAELGKDVALEIAGGDTELDKSVVEHIADPLMHLVRNALDHGLEAPAERLAAGKPAQGRLTLSACHESGSILIGISDDGRGIDRDKVLARAWDRGLVERGTVPPEQDLLRLIFEPGFSTAAQVTNLSGRGVGMDVVKRNVEALRGSVGVSSRPGEGSRIAIRLPLTLAIIDGFLVGVGGSKFIFPLDAVVEVIENRAVAATLDARGRGVVELRGQVLPVVGLRALYAIDAPAPERSSIVVIHAGERRYGVIVDALLGQHQTVIKPLSRVFRSLRGISGSSILGNGEVALIFDVAALAQLAADSTHSPLEGLAS